jgi:hypothetical protein
MTWTNREITQGRVAEGCTVRSLLDALHVLTCMDEGLSRSCARQIKNSAERHSGPGNPPAVERRRGSLALFPFDFSFLPTATTSSPVDSFPLQLLYPLHSLFSLPPILAMIPDAAARETAHLPSDPAKAPHANTLPPSAQPKKGSDLLSSPHSSDSNIPPYDSNGLGVTDHAQAGAFNLAQTPSHLAKLKAKHLESGLGDEDSSLNALGERTLSWQRAAVLL